MVEDYTDPEVMYENFGNIVDIVVHGGVGGMTPSTVVDCTTEPPTLVRQGLGPWQEAAA
jgi:tRNA A37 threonylcarbamoyladenosine synthetase subunit TsaC/SUA5/YrdC